MINYAVLHHFMLTGIVATDFVQQATQITLFTVKGIEPVFRTHLMCEMVFRQDNYLKAFCGEGGKYSLLQLTLLTLCSDMAQRKWFKQPLQYN